jgi:perosamine synthetase
MREGLSAMREVPVAGPWITEKEIAYVTDAAANAWYKRANEYYGRFEKTFAEYIGTKYAVCLPSCTSALHLSMAALKIGPGDEVILPDCTWTATAEPIIYQGGTPVFADIDRETWCLRPDAFEAAITPRTRAVIPVDLYGNVPEWDAILDIARRRSIAVVEDSAEAIGSTYKGKKAGAFGDTGVFSFHGTKTLTTGEGGMLVTDREDLYKRVLVLRDHGRKPGDTGFYFEEIGFKYKMSALQAALGLAQIERVEELITRKRQQFAWYQRELKNVPGLRINVEPPGTRNSYWMNTVVLDSKYDWPKEKLQKQLAAAGIATRPFFYPLSSLPAYKDYVRPAIKERNKVCYDISPWAINLPSALSLTEDDIRYVCDELKRLLGARG